MGQRHEIQKAIIQVEKNLWQNQKKVNLYQRELESWWEKREVIIGLALALPALYFTVKTLGKNQTIKNITRQAWAFTMPFAVSLTKSYLRRAVESKINDFAKKH